MATKKLKDEQKAAIEGAEAAAEETGTADPALAPETNTMPEPGSTGDLDVLNLDEAHGINPNVVRSGTKPDGKGGYQLLDEVNPAVANAALIPDAPAPEPKSPHTPPEPASAQPAEGEVRFKCTSDSRPWFSGGEMKSGETYIMSRSEAELLVGMKAGTIEGSGPVSDTNPNAASPA